MVVGVLVELSSKRIDKVFDYNVPLELESRISIGIRVIVPFGRMTLEGFVLNIKENSDVNRELKSIIEEHVALTDSIKGKEILEDFENSVKHFKKIIPADYKVIMKEIAHQKEHGADDETAKIEAFKVVVGGNK